MKSSFQVTAYLFVFLILLFLTACSQSETVSNEEQPAANQNDSTQQDVSNQEKKEVKTISVATTQVGSSFNAVGNGVATALNENSSIRGTVSPSAGLPAWGPQVDSGELDLGIAAGPELAWAYRGEEGYEQMSNLRLLVRGNYLPATGFVVREDSGIKSIADLKGKRVTSDYPGSVSTKILLDAALEVNGLSWDDVNMVPTTTTVDGVNALRENRVDAAYALAPATPTMQEAHNAVPMHALHFLDNVEPDQLDQVSQSVHDRIATLLPGARLNTIQPDGYVSEPTIAAEYPSLLVVSAHLSDEVVYEMMGTLWEHHEKMHPIHPWLKSWTPENMFDADPDLPYHSGTVQFFKDQGLWTDEVEEKQQQLLK